MKEVLERIKGILEDKFCRFGVVKVANESRFCSEMEIHVDDSAGWCTCKRTGDECLLGEKYNDKWKIKEALARIDREIKEIETIKPVD